MNADAFLDEDTERATSADSFLDTPESVDAFLDSPDDSAVQQEAVRTTAAALQAVDLMTLPQRILAAQPRELSRDEQLFQQSESIAAQMRQAEDAGQPSAALSEQYFALRDQIDPNFLRQVGDKQFAPDENTAATASDGYAAANPLGRGLSEIAAGLGLPFSQRLEELGRSPIGLNFQSNIGGAVTGAAGAGLMMVPGGQPLGANLLRVQAARMAAPVIGGITGGLAGNVAQEKIHAATETPEETEARHAALAETRQNSPAQSMLGASAANIFTMHPSLSQFLQAASGNRNAQMAIAGATGIGASMGIAMPMITGEPVTLSGIAQAALENMIFNKPTGLGRKLGLPSMEGGAPVREETGFQPVTIDPATAQSGLTTRPTTSTVDVFAGVRRPGEESPNVAPSQVVEEAAPAPETTAPFVEDVGRAVPPEAPATTAEPAQPIPENVTSIRNAQMDLERTERGLPPMDEVVPISNREMMQRAADMEAADPNIASRLVDELVEKPRAVETEEIFLLLRERVRLKSEYNQAGKRLIEAKEAGDESAVAAAQADVNAASDRMVKVEQAAGRGGAGTNQGRAFQARQAFANEDFSLAQMETDLRIDQGGAPLSEKQRATIAQQADTIAKTQVEMDKILAEREFQRAAAEADKTVDPKIKSLADRIVARLDLTAKNAATSLRSRLKNLNQLIPDPGIIADVAKIAAAKTAKGVIEFAQWSAEMVKEFGEKIRPFLQAGWDAREQYIDGEVNSVAGKQRKERSAADKEQSAIKARITSLANRTKEYQRRTKVGDFSPMRKTPTDLSKNPEWVKLKAENDSAKAAFEKARYEAKKAQRTTEQKVKDTVADVFSSSRSILASADISAVGRQGIFFALPDLMSNPVRLGRQMTRMLQSQFSEGKFQQNEARIKSRDNADLYEESGLYLADIDHKPSAREEQFKSEIAEKIPGVGRVVRGSSRGFASMMNEIRADAMDSFVNWSGGKENITPETAKFLAAAINDLSGRGNISSRKAQGALEWLATYLFSPRLWASRFNTAILRPIWRDPFNGGISPRARAVVVGQYAKFMGALLALKWLAGLNGGKMEEDPKDSDFGKLQFGSKRYDVMGGIGNMTTFLTRLATGRTKDDKGRVQRLVWKDEKQPDRDLRTVIFQHLRNKMAPIPGALFDLRYGVHPDRSKVTPTSMTKQTMVPITVSDTIEFFQKDDPASAARDALINSLGISTQDYRKK